MTVATPDTASFIAAQANLRARMGAPITFMVPTEPEWPEGTKINPTSGLPYDATIVQSNAEFTSVVKTCLIILKQASPLRPQPDTEVSALGESSGMDIILDIAAEDFSPVEKAAEFIAQGLDYKAVENKPFSIGGTIYRWLIYGLEK